MNHDKLFNDAFSQMIGNTPMVELKSLNSVLAKGKIFVKNESMNPGGEGHDRAAKAMIRASFDKLQTKKTVVIGTSGGLGISLAHLCKAHGFHLRIFLPADSRAHENQHIMEELGAKVTVQPADCLPTDENHYLVVAKRFALDTGALCLNQFEDLSNFNEHKNYTGPEIWKQTNGKIDCFVSSADSGGTIAGVSRFLKEQKTIDSLKVVNVILAEPSDNSQLISLDRGNGNNENLKKAKIDLTVKIEDQEIVDMAHWLHANEGLFVGAVSALNVLAACKVAVTVPESTIIVTVICDSGKTQLSRFWNEKYIVNELKLNWPHSGSVIPKCLSDIHPELPRYRGNCKCGKVKFKIFETDKLKVWGGYNCHCNMCIDVDKTHIDSRLGMGMRSIGVPDQGLRFEDELSRDNCIYTRTSAFAQRARSKCCNSPLFMKYDCEEYTNWVAVDALVHGDHEYNLLKLRYHINCPVKVMLSPSSNEENSDEEATGDDGALAFHSDDLSWWITDPCRPDDVLLPDTCMKCFQLCTKCKCGVFSSMKIKLPVTNDYEQHGSPIDHPPHHSPHASKYLDEEFISLLKDTHEHVLITPNTPPPTKKK